MLHPTGSQTCTMFFNFKVDFQIHRNNFQLQLKIGPYGPELIWHLINQEYTT